MKLTHDTAGPVGSHPHKKMGDINSCPIAYGREIAEKTVVPNKAGDLIKLSVQVVFIKKNQNAPSVTVVINYSVQVVFKNKNLNASKPSEHPPQVEECLKV